MLKWNSFNGGPKWKDCHGWTRVENWQEEAIIDFLLLFGCRISMVCEDKIELGDTCIS